MEAGGLDVAWFVVYTGQGPITEEGYAAAYENAIDKFDAIHRLMNCLHFGFADISRRVHPPLKETAAPYPDTPGTRPHIAPPATAPPPAARPRTQAPAAGA